MRETKKEQKKGSSPATATIQIPVSHSIACEVQDESVCVEIQLFLPATIAP
jgi:hypothetical protein